MQVNQKINFLLILAAVTLLLAGCEALQIPVETAPKPDSGELQSNTTPKRFRGAISEGLTAVDSTIKLAREHAELAEKMTVLQQEKQELVTENSRLKNKIAELEPKLRQAEKELSQANEQLMGLIVELNNWKVSVTGFQDEMREADKAQLEALLRILKVLGGEVETETSQQPGRDSTVSSSDTQSKPESKETNVSGEPNE